MDKTLKDRVKRFLTVERLSYSEFGRMAGVSAAYVNSIKKSISFEMLEKIKNINPRLNINWLLWGEGAMFSSDLTLLKKVEDENKILKDKVAMLEKIIALYERNENAKN